MPSPIFITLAVAMVAGALLVLVTPLLRRSDPSPIAAGAVVALIPLSVAVLYFVYSNWPWGVTQTASVRNPTTQEQAPAVGEMVARLEQRLMSDPNDAEGWQMLGRSYVVLERYPDAVEAYARARELGSDTNVHAVTGYAEALALARGGSIDNEISELFEKALKLAPNDRKGLWYGGLAAFERDQPELARDRWQKLLDLGPPEQMAALLREQISAANAALGNTLAVPVEPSPTRATRGVELEVSLAPELATQVRQDAPLFILARQIDTPGPPLAVVRRQVSDLPLQLVLTDADAMAPGRVLSAHDSVEIVARVALGGTATAQPGDLAGSKIVASDGSAMILIDSVVGN